MKSPLSRGSRIHASLAAAVLGGLLVTGCQLPGQNTLAQIDDGLLAEVSVNDMNSIQRARAVRDSAKDDLARSQRQARRQAQRAELARMELKMAALREEDARMRVEFDEAEGTVAELETSRQRSDWTSAEITAADLRVELRDLQVTHAELVVDFADAVYNLRASEVELAKAEAVRQLNRASVQGMSFDHFSIQVEEWIVKVELARTRMAESEQLVTAARTEFAHTFREAQALEPQED